MTTMIYQEDCDRVANILNHHFSSIASVLAVVLAEERERCAKIAETAPAGADIAKLIRRVGG